MNKVTPLLTFLRALTKDQRKAMAERCGTTEVYLYQLAGQPWPNPRLRLALALVAESKPLARKQMTSALTLDGLMVGTSDEPVPSGLDR